MEANKTASEFLADHSERIETEAGKRKQELDAFSKHYEEFVRPWDGAWNLLKSTLEQWRNKKDPQALADAVRRIVRLANQAGYEEKIRIAADRCRRLAEKDPTGETFHLCDVSDLAAVLMILLAELEGDEAVDELAEKLAITHSLVGDGLRCEVECAGQMVTLQAGTPAVLSDPPEATGGEGTPPDATAEQEVEAPFKVDVALSQIRIDGAAIDVSSGAARMAEILLDSDGEWVSMREHDFSKPSETKKALPASVLKLIETEKGKGYRLKPRQ